MGKIDLSAFEKALENDGKSPRTVTGYLRDVRLFATWFEQTNGETLTPQTLTTIDARQYRQHLLVTDKARPATINRKLAALRAYSDWARSSGQVDYSLVNGVKNVEEVSTGPRWLSKKEQAALLREAQKEIGAAQTAPARRQARRDYAVLVVLLNTGLRIGELCALELEDVEIGERKGEVCVRQGKGGKARVVPLNKEARKALQEWLEYRPTVNSQAVFTTQFGSALQPRGVQLMLKEFGRRAKVEVTPHQLRHTFAKNLIDHGVSLEKVARLLGHSNLNTTMVYTIPSQADLAQAVEALVD